MKLKLMIVAAAAVAALVPVGALAHHGGEEPNPAHTCKAQQQMGAEAFKALYGGGSNAFGKCVSTAAKQQQQNANVAKSACAAERAADKAAFAQKYGSKGLGKCVSQSAKQRNAAQTRATMNAAKQCKALTAAQLAADYGAGKNAFGKCIAARAKTKNP